MHTECGGGSALGETLCPSGDIAHYIGHNVLGVGTVAVSERPGYPGRRHTRTWYAYGWKKNLVPPPNRRALDWSVVLTVGIGAWARLDYVAFDAQLQKAYFVTTLYDIIMYVCV